MQDAYWSTPQGTYDERRQRYLEYCAADNTGGRTGLFSQIGRLELGREPVNEAAIREGIDYVYSQHPIHWRADAQGAQVELRADSPDNIWVCELGSVDEWGSFTAFVEAVTAAEIQCDDLSVIYHSPSVGKVELAWNGPLRVDGTEVKVHNYPRFDNPYCHANFGAKVYDIAHAGQTHEIAL